MNAKKIICILFIVMIYLTINVTNTSYGDIIPIRYGKSTMENNDEVIPTSSTEAIFKDCSLNHTNRDIESDRIINLYNASALNSDTKYVIYYYTDSEIKSEESDADEAERVPKSLVLAIEKYIKYILKILIILQ